MQSNIAQSPCLQYRTSKKKVENTAIIVLLYCLKLVLFLVFSLLYFLCRGPFTRSQLCLQLTHLWNKPSNSIFVFTFVNDYDWHDFDRSPTGLCQTRSGVKWVDTQKPGGFLPALLFLPLSQSPPLHYHAPKEVRKQTFSGSIFKTQQESRLAG